MMRVFFKMLRARPALGGPERIWSLPSPEFRLSKGYLKHSLHLQGAELLIFLRGTEIVAAHDQSARQDVELCEADSVEGGVAVWTCTYVQCAPNTIRFWEDGDYAFLVWFKRPRWALLEQARKLLTPCRDWRYSYLLHVFRHCHQLSERGKVAHLHLLVLAQALQQEDWPGCAEFERQMLSPHVFCLPLFGMLNLPLGQYSASVAELLRNLMLPPGGTFGARRSQRRRTRCLVAFDCVPLSCRKLSFAAKYCARCAWFQQLRSEMPR